VAVNRPDFEKYALQKSFNRSVADAWAAAARRAMAHTGRDPASLTFLDLGCGDGKYYGWLRQEGLDAANIHGVEASRTRVERCHAMGWSNVRFVAPGDQLPYADASFDVVNFMEVIEHVPADMVDGVLSEIRRVLRPEGVLMVSTPNYPIKRVYDVFDAVLHGKLQRLKDDPTHVAPYTEARLRRLVGSYFTKLEQHGFKDGFLYRRLRHPLFRHKLFFLCSGPTRAGAAATPPAR
jgi:2-polyprenyl-3-methyl-5-hydroxy-6-metoxy-1,4-benzoquinol methylase